MCVYCNICGENVGPWWLSCGWYGWLMTERSRVLFRLLADLFSLKPVVKMDLVPHKRALDVLLEVITGFMSAI